MCSRNDFLNKHLKIKFYGIRNLQNFLEDCVVLFETRKATSKIINFSLNLEANQNYAYLLWMSFYHDYILNILALLFEISILVMQL